MQSVPSVTELQAKGEVLVFEPAPQGNRWVRAKGLRGTAPELKNGNQQQARFVKNRESPLVRGETDREGQVSAG